MCLWKTLSGPSLESDTYHRMRREQTGLILEEGCAYDEFVTLGLEVLAEAELRV